MSKAVMKCPVCGETVLLTSKDKGKTIPKRVVKIDCNGKVVERYRSINEAANKNPLSRNAVKNRLNRRMKCNEFDLYGYSFRYERS